MLAESAILRVKHTVRDTCGNRRPEPHGIVKGDKIWGGMKRMKNNRKRVEMMMMKFGLVFFSFFGLYRGRCHL